MAQLLLPNFVDSYNKGVDRGNAMRFNALAGQAMASPDQSQQLLGQAAQINPMGAAQIQNVMDRRQAVQDQAQQATQADHAKKLHAAASYVYSAIQQGDPTAINNAYQAARPIVEGITGKQMPDQFDPSMTPYIARIALQTGGINQPEPAKPQLIKTADGYAWATPGHQGVSYLTQGSAQPQTQGPQQGGMSGDPMNPLLAEANAKVKAGEDPNQVEAWLKQQATAGGMQVNAKPDFGMQHVMPPQPVSGRPWHMLTPDEIAKRNLPKGTIAQISPNNQIHILQKGAESGEGLSSSALDAVAWDYIFHGHTALSSLGRKSQEERKQVLNRVADIAHQAGVTLPDLATQQGRTKAIQASLNNMQKKVDVMRMSEDAFSNNANTLMQLSSQLGRYSSPIVNKWVLGGKEAMGDPQVSALDSSINAVAMDYARIMAGNTGAGGTPIYTMEDAKGLIRRELSHKTLGAVIKVLNTDIANQQRAADSRLEFLRHAMSQFGTGVERVPGPPQTGQTAPNQAPIDQIMSKYGSQ